MKILTIVHQCKRRLPVCDFLSLLWCAGLLLTALYLQYIENLIPCPMCILQRSVYFALLLVYLGGWFYFPKKLISQIGYRILLTFLVCSGLWFSGRHWWLQQLPPDPFTSCTSHLGHFFEVLPWHEAIIRIFAGGTECHEVAWMLWGISLPGWSFIGFVMVLIFILLACVPKWPSASQRHM